MAAHRDTELITHIGAVEGGDDPFETRLGRRKHPENIVGFPIQKQCRHTGKDNVETEPIGRGARVGLCSEPRLGQVAQLFIADRQHDIGGGSAIEICEIGHGAVGQCAVPHQPSNPRKRRNRHPAFARSLGDFRDPVIGRGQPRGTVFGPAIKPHQPRKAQLI